MTQKITNLKRISNSKPCLRLRRIYLASFLWCFKQLTKIPTWGKSQCGRTEKEKIKSKSEQFLEGHVQVPVGFRKVDRGQLRQVYRLAPYTNVFDARLQQQSILIRLKNKQRPLR